MNEELIQILREHSASSAAIVDMAQSKTTSYGDLCAAVERTAGYLKKLPDRSLVFLFTNYSTDSIVVYLACLYAKLPVCLLESRDDELPQNLIQSYGRPYLLMPKEQSTPAYYVNREEIPELAYSLVSANQNPEQSLIHPDLCLLLQTSGSTGNPRLVRLAWKNLRENAKSIVSYLQIAPGQRSIQSLPMSYSYGLSLIHSHLFAGATVALSAHSFFRPEFWNDFDRSDCTSFAGVPFMYETLDKLRFDPKNHPSLGLMTQAGGALRKEIKLRFAQKTKSAGASFYVMYGQTEATARISYVPPELLEEKMDSIGVPIPNGRLELTDVPGLPDRQELIYHGPNVMMGYAENLHSLSLGDECQGRLATGDLGHCDAKGFFYIQGRLKRFAKLFGMRVQLEDIENKLESEFALRAAAVDGGDVIAIFLASTQSLPIARIQETLSRWLLLPQKAFLISQIDELPMNASGKKDYRKLQTQ